MLSNSRLTVITILVLNLLKMKGACGSYRRCGQARPPDRLRTGVQRCVFVLVENRMHTESLLAVHGHHDCRS